MPTAVREWYRVRVEKKEDDAAPVSVVEIFDFIGDWFDDFWGFGVTAKQFVETLRGIPDDVRTIRVRVKSPGGDVFAAQAIANLLRDEQTKGRTVEVLIEGLAASAATIVTSAGSPGEVRIADNAMMFVHNPWTVSVGNAVELRKAADDLDRIRGTIITAYQWRSEKSAEDLGALMDAETMLDAEQSVENGLADEIVSGLPAAAAAFHPRGAEKFLAALPEPLRERLAKFVVARKDPAPTVDPPAPTAPAPAPVEKVDAASAADVVKWVAEAGLDGRFALALIESGATVEKARASIWRAREIRAACALAKLPTLADDYIEGGMTVERVKSSLTRISTLVASPEIDGSLLPDGSPTKKIRADLDPSTIYAERNRARTPKEG